MAHQYGENPTQFPQQLGTTAILQVDMPYIKPANNT